MSTVVYATNINDIVEERKIRSFYNMVSIDKRKKLDKYKKKDDFLRSLYADIIVRKKIERISNIDCRDLQFYENIYGKPYVSGIENIYFNISHSGKWVVVIVSNFECGIDVEAISEPYPLLVKRYFHELEYQKFLNLTEKEQIAYFYELWVLKESYVKWRGTGLSIPFNSFLIEYESMNRNAYVKTDDKVNLLLVKFDQEYKLSLCIEENLDELCYINMNTIVYS